jgi:aryl-alcohol dehydrogenase-like predicted oxidoreductase
MPTDLQKRPFGATGINVSPVGLSASYYPGAKTIRTAIDIGINLFFAFGIDVQMTRTLRGITPSERDRLVIATGAYNYVWAAQNVRRAFEKRLRQFKTDYIDIFLFMGVMKPGEFRPEVEAELMKLKDEGKVRAIGVSCHDRRFLGTLATKGTLNALMLRYNAAHRGAEADIFPHLAAHNPGVISYTATRWTYLLRPPRGWPKNGRVPTAGECYRFVLSDPHVHVVLTAPKNERELRENVASILQGPLDPDDMRFMREFGDAVHTQKKWFM